MSDFHKELLTKAEEKAGKKASFFAFEDNIDAQSVHRRDEGADSCELIVTHYDGVRRYMVIYYRQAIIVDDLDIALEIARGYVNDLWYAV